MASNCSGNSYRFLSEPDDSLKCLICLEVAKEPWQQYDCGGLFCKKCLDKHGRTQPCPNCRIEQPQYFPDNRGKREIRSLRVKCNAECTCTWEGTVGTVEEHVTTCQFTLLPCPNQCKGKANETNHFMRKDLEDHLKEDCPNRDYECEYCGEEGTYATITQVHDETCERKIVPCTNTGCRKTMQRQQLFHHVMSLCEHTVIACKHKSIGCDMKLKRKDMAAHELDNKLHLHLAINAISLMKRDIIGLETQLNKITSLSIMQLKQQDSMSSRLADYQERKESNKEFISSSFYTSHGYHMALSVYANGNGTGEGTHVSVYAPIMEGKYDPHLRWPLVGSVTVTLLNQLEDKNHDSAVIPLNRERNAIVGVNWGIPKFISHSALGHDPIKNTQYLKDNTLYFRMSVEVENDKPWLKCI